MATFDRTGVFGIGEGRPPADEDPLVGHLGELADNPDRRRELGEFGRKLFQERYSLDAMAAALDKIYREAALSVPSFARRTADGLLTSLSVVRHQAAGRGLLVSEPVYIIDSAIDRDDDWRHELPQRSCCRPGGDSGPFRLGQHGGLTS